MRKITSAIKAAFDRREPKLIGNTSTDGQSVWLHHNRILYRDNQDRIWFSLAGWPTSTTRERLKAGGVSINQVNGVQYYGPHSLNADNWYHISNGVVLVVADFDTITRCFEKTA